MTHPTLPHSRHPEHWLFPLRSCRGVIVLFLLTLLAGGKESAIAQCTGVTTAPGMGLSSASFGPVVVTQAMHPDGVTPAPLGVGDCSGDGAPDLQIPWSGAGARPPATFWFSTACPTGANYAIVTFSGSETTWIARDNQGVVVNSASFPAGVQITMSLAGPRIDTLTVKGVDLCIHQVCWGCPPPPPEPPLVRISEPFGGQVFLEPRISLEGTVAAPDGLARLTLLHESLDSGPAPNRVALDWTGKAPRLTFPGKELHVNLLPGRNRLTVSGEDPKGRKGQAAVEVVFAPPPEVIIESPARGSRVQTKEVTVRGRIKLPYGTLLKENVTIAVAAGDPRFEDLPPRAVEKLTPGVGEYAFESTIPLSGRLGDKSTIMVAAGSIEGVLGVAEIDLEIDFHDLVRAGGLDVTQATLSPLLVAGDRVTVARLIPMHSNPFEGVLENVTAELHAFRMGTTELPASPISPASPIDIDPADSFEDRRNDASRTWNFVLPHEWQSVEGEVRLVAVIDPGNTLGESGAWALDNNTYNIPDPAHPERTGTTVTFTNGQTLQIRPVAIRYRFDGDWVAAPTEEEVQNALEGIIRTYPFRDIDILPTITDQYRVHLDGTGPASRDGIEDILRKMHFEHSCPGGVPGYARIWDCSSGPTYIIGLIDLFPTGTDCPGAASLTDNVSCVSDPRPWQAARALGLCLGRELAGGCEDDGPMDPDFPYPDGGIGAVGLDTSMGAADPSSLWTIPPEGPFPIAPPYLRADPLPPCEVECCATAAIAHDFMSCRDNPKWISPHTWEGLFDYGFAGPRWAGRPGLPDFPPEEEDPFKPWMIVIHGTGSSSRSGALTLDPLYTHSIPGHARFPQIQGAFEARALGDRGQVLARQGFSGMEMVGQGGSRAIDFVLPFPPGTSRLEVWRGGERLAEREVSAHSPTVAVLYPNGEEDLPAEGLIEVRWEAADADGDPLHSLVRYSPDDGRSWTTLGVFVEETSLVVHLSELVGGARARIQVMASDGILTASDDSDAPFSVAQKPPYPLILSPRDGAMVAPGSSVILRGTASDSEDGPLHGERLTWKSDRDGVLGKGRRVDAARLSPGLHHITFAAVDSAGATEQKTIALMVGEAPARPVFLRADANGDRVVNIADAIGVLAYLFTGGKAPPCESAADSNDDGEVNLSDASFTLSFLFLGGHAPPGPFPEPGHDLTPDGLTCEEGAFAAN